MPSLSARLVRLGRVFCLLMVALAVGLAAAPAFAQKNDKGGKGQEHGKSDRGAGRDKGPGKNAGKGHGKGHGRVVKNAERNGVSAESLLAVGATAATLAGYLGPQRELLAVGAAPLPPGIRKNLARGKPMPPGLAWKPAPPSVIELLPVVEEHRWVMSGTDLILVAAGTMVVGQILENVFN